MRLFLLSGEGVAAKSTGTGFVDLPRSPTGKARIGANIGLKTDGPAVRTYAPSV